MLGKKYKKGVKRVKRIIVVNLERMKIKRREKWVEWEWRGRGYKKKLEIKGNKKRKKDFCVW